VASPFASNFSRSSTVLGPVQDDFSLFKSHVLFPNSTNYFRMSIIQEQEQRIPLLITTMPILVMVK
jgi:hypothetical protein